MSVRQAAEYCSLSNHSQIVIWLQRVKKYKKYGINGLIRQPNRKKNVMRLPKRPVKTAEKELLL
ncbi:hypothetical protein ACLSZ7_00235 [Avibacterium gallinarum]|uniref:Uncharacterized protein n=1 Tax=Avibacterium gallinarum TaxID=755 RepID=A0A379AUL7_AVIGA|nr:hypothetical protein [Avibacterium gallinarum]TDP29677.1 hypothetical protein EV689_102206 [Avibacterium gallinarum]SUB25744.1 Uncharacterised protein [Avibacterium gallinarum]